MSSIFFTKISVVDHARLTANGPVGGSYNLSVIASVPRDMMDEEQVVVDFSSGKKRIKDMIDAHKSPESINGFDHKLWVPNDVCFDRRGGDVVVEDEFVRVSGPADMFKFVDIRRGEMNSITATEHEMAKLIQSQDDHVEYIVRLDETPYDDTITTRSYNSVTKMFSYMHGLPKSSSFGCKCISHGHRSFVRVNATDHAYADYVSDLIVDLLDNTYLVHKDHKSDDHTYSYTTCRGPMSIVFKHQYYDGMGIIEMDVEPTIENIIDMVVNSLGDKLVQPAIIMISEGLQKGAIRVIE